MTESTDDMRKRHAKELADIEKRQTIQTAVTAALSLDSSAWTAGFMHPTPGADCFIIREAADLPAAIHLAEVMNPVALARVQGSSLSFRPLDRVTERDAARATVEPITPYIYDLDGLTGRPEEKTLRFFVSAADYVVEVRVRVAHDPDTYRVHEVTKRDRKTGEVREEKRDLVNRSGHFPHVVRWWSSPGEPGRFTLWSR